jgi:hypothetical protein
VDDKQSGGGNTQRKPGLGIQYLGFGRRLWFFGGYTVAAPEPDLYLGSFLFLVAVLLSIAAGWVYFTCRPRWKIIVSLLILVAFGFSDRRIFVNYAKKRSEQQLRDTFSHLIVVPDSAAQERPFSTLFTITNGGDADIPWHSVSCKANWIYFSGGFMLGGGSSISASLSTVRIG